MPKTTDHIAVSTFVELLLQHGISKVISSPGSRNAPFIIACNARNDLMDLLNINDERSAAFFALGMAQYAKLPVVLVCTSGTAVLNYAPAVAEAFYQRIPLIVVSADRPEHLINQEESQTTTQHRALANHVLRSYTFPVLKSKKSYGYYNRLMNEAIILAKNKFKPVHLNFHLKEPLYNTIQHTKTYARKIEHIPNRRELDEDVFKMLAKKLYNSSKVMLLGGSHYPCDELQNCLSQVVNKCNNVVLLTENLTNLSGENLISTIDRTIFAFKEEEARSFSPDILVSFGGILVSRMIKSFLRKYKPKENWHLSFEENIIDMYGALSYQLPISSKSFFKKILPHLNPGDSNYQNLWISKNQTNLAKHTSFIAKSKWCDLRAFDKILKHIPEQSVLQLGNSTVVRYTQLFECKSTIKYFSNRGSSGIEGSISTAIGSCYMSGKTTTVIVGDQSFLYDSNALWNSYLRKKVKIIVINNGGGGIFRFIEGPSQTEHFEKYFEASHRYSFEDLARQFNIIYFVAKNEAELSEVLPKVYANDEVIILEVQTSREENAEILRNYFKNFKNKS